jgi:hypothetical protein
MESNLTQLQQNIFNVLVNQANESPRHDDNQPVFTTQLAVLGTTAGYTGNSTSIKDALFALAKITVTFTEPGEDDAVVSSAFPLLSAVAVDDSTGRVEFSIPAAARGIFFLDDVLI